MAVRITHTNNSDGHDGTFVYRSTSTMDPQDLPTPIADEPPVALGAVFEYIDGDIAELIGQLCYRTQDHEDGQLSTVSDEVCVVNGIGEELGGGIYAGLITYADGRQFHIISAKASGEGIDLIWSSDTSTTTGVNDVDDGLANQNNLLTNHDNGSHTAFYHCRDYSGGGHADWYLPAKNELTLLYNSLSDHPEFSDNVASGDEETWSSTENNADEAWVRLFANGTEYDLRKNTVRPRTRPIRRIPA